MEAHEFGASMAAAFEGPDRMAEIAGVTSDPAS
jgi:hypothetical protein